MAHLRTASRAATLLPQQAAAPQMRPTPRKREVTVEQLDKLTEKARKAVGEAPPTHCDTCVGRMQPVKLPTKRGEGARYVKTCTHCAKMFGSGFGCGSTNARPDEILEKLHAVRQEGFVMVLRSLSLGAANGDVVNVCAGDIFPVHGTPRTFSDTELVSWERTRAMFTMPLPLGPHQTHLYGHEFAPISLSRVMEMRRLGQISETFITTDDHVGHFTPSVDLQDKAHALSEAVFSMPPAVAKAIVAAL